MNRNLVRDKGEMLEGRVGIFVRELVIDGWSMIEIFELRRVCFGIFMGEVRR